MEQFRDVFSRIFTKSKASSAIPITVIVFKDDNAFKPYKPLYQGKPATVSGYYQPGEDVNYIMLTSEFRETNPYAVIFHEYVHALTSDNSRPLPPWLSEGIAEYYSSFEVESNEKKVWLGKAIANHVFTCASRSFCHCNASSRLITARPNTTNASAKACFMRNRGRWFITCCLAITANGSRSSCNSSMRWLLVARLTIASNRSSRPITPRSKRN